MFVHGQPAPVALSISHSDGVALCTLSDAESAIGCDVELVEPRGSAFIADYFTDDEQAFFETAGLERRDELATLFWSAKESTLKARRCGLRVNTRELCVQLPGNRKATVVPGPRPISSIQSPCWDSLSVLFDGQIFQGWWRRENRLIRTIVRLAAESLSQQEVA